MQGAAQTDIRQILKFVTLVCLYYWKHPLILLPILTVTVSLISLDAAGLNVEFSCAFMDLAVKELSGAAEPAQRSAEEADPGAGHSAAGPVQPPAQDEADPDPPEASALRGASRLRGAGRDRSRGCCGERSISLRRHCRSCAPCAHRSAETRERLCASWACVMQCMTFLHQESSSGG